MLKVASLTKNIVDKLSKNPEALSMGERKLVRDNAISRAETTMEDGVKVTKMPYMGKVGEVVAKRPKPTYPTDQDAAAALQAYKDSEKIMAREMRLADRLDQPRQLTGELSFKKGGKVKKMSSGGSTASKRADGCAQRGKTRGKMC